MSSALSESTLFFSNFAHGLILDAGCGIGLFAETLKKHGNVVGVDIKRAYLKVADYEDKVLCSVGNLPFRSEAFDFIWACAVIEHVKEDCVLEIARVGKNTVFLTPNKNSPLELMRRIMGKKGKWEVPDHVRLYTIDELEGYGKVLGGACGLPKRSLWLKFLPLRFWLLMPKLSHTIFLIQEKNGLRKQK